MSILRRGMCSITRKPVKSLLLLLVVVVISSFFMAGLASRSASVNVQDSTRQAVGATFRLELNEANRHTRLEEAWVFQDMDYICCSSYGRPRSTTYIYTHYKKLIEEAGLPYIRFHDLRHTYTTLLMKNDINQKAIAASLGHSKSIITFDVYTDKQALIEGGVEEIDAFIDEVHPYDSEDIQILKEKYGKKVLHRLA